MQRIIDVACEACRKAENAGLLSRGRLRRAAARTVAEQSELLRRTAPWLKDAAIPGTYAGAAAYRDEASRITLDHVRKPFQERIDRLSGRLAGERFNQRFAERLERNLDAARTLKPRRPRIRRRGATAQSKGMAGNPSRRHRPSPKSHACPPDRKGEVSSASAGVSILADTIGVVDGRLVAGTKTDRPASAGRRCRASRGAARTKGAAHAHG